MTPDSILALDVGDKRIGVAVARADVRFPRPLLTLTHDETIWQRIEGLMAEHDAGVIVVGLPRGLDGQETEQTRKAEAFVAALKERINVPVHLMDEATTSLKAEAELKSRGKPYEKSDIDALAATYILDDYLTGQGA
jgi:putative Holliday junction resolvase